MQVLSINLLLATHTSCVKNTPTKISLMLHNRQSIPRVEDKAQKSHVTLLASILEKRLRLEQIEGKVTATQTSIQSRAKIQLEKTTVLGNQLDEAATTLRSVQGTETITTTIFSIRDVVSQLLPTYGTYFL